MRATAFAVPANRLLAALPRALYRGLFGKLESVPFELGVILYEAGESPRYVYFPSDVVDRRDARAQPDRGRPGRA
jgi:hypothetical protein